MSNTSIEKKRQEAIKENSLFSKTRLKDEFRMKPGTEQKPEKYVKGQYGSHVALWAIADCVPMRPKAKKKALSDKQIRNQKLFSLKGVVIS